MCLRLLREDHTKYFTWLAFPQLFNAGVPVLTHFCPLCFVIKGDVIEEEVDYSVKFICDDHKYFPTKFAVIPKICTNYCPLILQYSSIFLCIFCNCTLQYTESSSFFYLNIHCYLLKSVRSKELPLAGLQFIVGELPGLFDVIRQKHRRDSS